MDKINFRKYGKIYPFYLGGIRLSMVSDEELLKQILIKDTKSFTDRMNLGLRGKSTDKMLTVLTGKDWERVRNLVTPTFTSGKLRKMSVLISDGINLLEERITNYPVENPINFKEFFGAFTMDVIARTMFGLQIDSQTNPNNTFITYAKKLFTFSFFHPVIVMTLIFPEFVRLIAKIMPILEDRERDTFQFFNDTLEKAIAKRRESTEQYNDFLALMLKAHKEISENDPDQSTNLDSKSLTIQEIMAQSIVFLLAGYENVAATLSYLTYFLAKDQVAQQEVYGEILDAIGIGGEITYETVMNMPLLDAAVSETLRICPPAVRFDRKCSHDTILITSKNEKIFAKKGDVFVVPIYAIHMDPAIWPDPDRFDLHRFDPENKKNHSPYSYMPFGMGPRNCIGMRFALLEAKWAIVSVLQKFKIVPCAETIGQITFNKTGLVSITNPILLKVERRE